MTSTWADGPMLGFDLETTGKDPFTARIVTASVVSVGVPNPRGLNWLTDVGGEVIPDEAAAIHGVTTEHARTHGRPLREVVSELRAWIEGAWSRMIPVVGHNIAYDLTVLAAEIARFGGEPLTVRGPVIDTLVLDRALNRRRGKGAHTLTSACRVYGVELSEEDAHSAYADALAALRVAWKIARRYPQVGCMSLRDLYVWQKRAHREHADEWGAYLISIGRVDEEPREWPIRRLP